MFPFSGFVGGLQPIFITFRFAQKNNLAHYFPYQVITRLAGMENEPLKLVTKQEQAELLHRVLASTDEDALEEHLPADPDGLVPTNRRTNPFQRRVGHMSSLSGADDAIYMDTAAQRRDKAAKERHPLFKLFRV